MDTSSLDSNMLTLMAMLAGSWISLAALMIRQSNRHEDSIGALDTKLTDRIDALDTKFTGSIGALDTKFTGRIDVLDTKLTGRIDALDTKLTGRIDSLGRDMADVRERLGRVEGHLMAPEGFRPRLRRPPSEDDRPSGGPEPGHRQAG